MKKNEASLPMYAYEYGETMLWSKRRQEQSDEWETESVQGTQIVDLASMLQVAQKKTSVGARQAAQSSSSEVPVSPQRSLGGLRVSLKSSKVVSPSGLSRVGLDIRWATGAGNRNLSVQIAIPQWKLRELEQWKHERSETARTGSDKVRLRVR